jgi:hypothetical protein
VGGIDSMVLWIALTILDFLVASGVLFIQIGAFDSWRILFSGGIYLIGKGLFFPTSMLSIIDIFCGIYILLMIFGLHTFLGYVIVAYLLYKVLLFVILSR